MTARTQPTVCIIGAGRMGRRHANVVAAHDGATLGTVVDAARATAKEVADTHNADWSTEAGEALSTADACIVSTPEDTHATIVEQAIEYDCDILLEKPIANSLADADKIVDVDESTSRAILVGHILRFDPRYRYLKNCVEDGRIGELRSVNARRAIPKRWVDTIPSSVHPLIQTAVHEIDIIRWLFGTEPASIYADEYRDADGSLDGISALLSFDQGIATLETSFIWPPDATAKMSSRTELLGTNGQVDTQLPDRSCQSAGADFYIPDLLLWPTVDGRITGSLRNQFDHFLECIDGADPLVSAADAATTLRVARGILGAVDKEESVSRGTLDL